MRTPLPTIDYNKIRFEIIEKKLAEQKKVIDALLDYLGAEQVSQSDVKIVKRGEHEKR